MNINDIMTDGEIDGQKMYKMVLDSYAELWEDFDELARVINAHIVSLAKQETPITEELLKRAGFNVAKDGGWYKKIFRFNEGFLMILVRQNCFTVKTMEQLATIYECYTGEPLNWQHDPGRELRERLEAMGFEQTKKGCFFLGLGMIYFNCFINNGFFVEMGAAYSMGEFVTTNIKTIDALERLVKELKGE